MKVPKNLHMWTPVKHGWYCYRCHKHESGEGRPALGGCDKRKTKQNDKDNQWAETMTHLEQLAQETQP